MCDQLVTQREAIIENNRSFEAAALVYYTGDSKTSVETYTLYEYMTLDNQVVYSTFSHQFNNLDFKRASNGQGFEQKNGDSSYFLYDRGLSNRTSEMVDDIIILHERESLIKDKIKSAGIALRKIAKS